MGGRPLRRLREKTRDEDGLLPDERKFCDRVLIHADYNRAIRESFPTGRSRTKLLENPAIARVLKRESQELHERYQLSEDWVIRELAYLARFDPRKLFNEDGTTKPMQELDEATAAALTGIDIEEEKTEVDNDNGTKTITRTLKFRYADKHAALQTAMKHLRIDGATRHEVTGANGSPLVPPVFEINFGKPEDDPKPALEIDTDPDDSDS